MNGGNFIELEHTVSRHEDDLDALDKRIAELKDDLEVILRATNVVAQVRGEVKIAERPKSAYSGAQRLDPALLAKYRAFLERYGSIGGVPRYHE